MGVYSNYVNDNFKKPLDIPLNEAYFGMSKDLEKIIEVLGEYRKKYMVENNSVENAFSYDLISKSKCNTDNKLYEFNRLMEKFFGFKSFSLHVSPDHKINAYTVAYTTRANRLFNPKKDLVQTKNGIAYNRDINATCVVYIYGALIFNPDYTDREVMAIIMHEVGHNFSFYEDGFIQITSAMEHLYKPLVIAIQIIIDIMHRQNNLSIIAMYSGEYTLQLYEDIRKEILNNPIGSCIVDVCNMYSKYINHFCDLISDIKSYVPIDPSRVIQFFEYLLKNMNILYYISKFRNEKLADNFATMYGLGPDLSSALNKFNSNTTASGPSGIMNKLNNVPVVGWYKDITMIPILFLLSLVDEHPMSEGRFRSQVNYLKAEINKEDIDPKVKKDLMDQVNYMETEINKQYKMIDGAKDPRLVRKLYSAFLIDVFGGDPRSVFEGKNRYNKKYDKVLDKIKMV